VASEPAAVPGGLAAVQTETERPEPRPAQRAWLLYVIALSAIALPALVLVCVSSIPAGRFDTADLRTGAGRGDFLIPVLILCAEAVRCWMLEVRRAGLIGKVCRPLAFALCTVTGIVCFAATVIAAATPATPATTRSVEAITIGSMGIAALFGLTALITVAAIRESR
jgi:hypothetical protein